MMNPEPLSRSLSFATRPLIATLVDYLCGELAERASPTPTPHPQGPVATLSPHDAAPVADKWNLWAGDTHPCGANICQRLVYPELDGRTSMGPGPVGQPYIQDDLDPLAALGADYVNVSHPGLFSEDAPYVLDQGIQDNLHNLLDMIAQADSTP
jgi:hypothetical protein